MYTCMYRTYKSFLYKIFFFKKMENYMYLQMPAHDYTIWPEYMYKFRQFVQTAGQNIESEHTDAVKKQ